MITPKAYSDVLFIIVLFQWSIKLGSNSRAVIPFLLLMLVFLTGCGHLLSGQQVAPASVSDVVDQDSQDSVAALLALRQPNPPFEVRLWAEKESYYVGEAVTLYFEAERACYLTVIDIGTNGDLTVLFPNRFHQDNFIEGGKQYTIPHPDYGFTLDASPPSGVERLKAIATTTPLALFEEIEFGKFFWRINRGDREDFRDTIVSKQELSATVWTEASTHILILDRERSAPRKRELTERKPQDPIDILGTTGAISRE